MKTLDYLPNVSNMNGWQDRHMRAIWSQSQTHHERAIVGGIKAWLAYAEAHGTMFDSTIGEDYVLGPEWAAWGRALLGLLNGECGRLDCGTLDTIIRDNLTEQGYGDE